MIGTSVMKELRSENTCSRFLLQLYNMPSSAKLQICDFLMDKNKLFMKILKRRGPRIDPCGTPLLILHHELKDEVLYFRLVR